MTILDANTDPDLLTRLRQMLGSAARADIASAPLLILIFMRISPWYQFSLSRHRRRGGNLTRPLTFVGGTPEQDSLPLSKPADLRRVKLVIMPYYHEFNSPLKMPITRLLAHLTGDVGLRGFG